MTDAPTPEHYIAGLDEPRRSDVRRLHELIITAAPELEAYADNSGIGYGRYRFRYRTGREGDWSTIGLASQKRYISLYISGDRHGNVAERYRDRLPKTDISRWCVRAVNTSRCMDSASGTV